MTHADAMDFLRPAVDVTCTVWADLGAGSGTFTAALAQILGEESTIYAVDNDARAVSALQQLQLPSSAAKVIPLLASIDELSAIPELASTRLDAALVSNVLHYFPRPEEVLKDVTARLSGEGRIVVVEYDRTSANPWVPYPIPVARLPAIAESAGLRWHGVLNERPSRYQGTLYCGFLTAADGRTYA